MYTTVLFLVSIILRLGFFLFGLYQDAYLPVKYTDIDYLVFSDAAQYVALGHSPYDRETYRYTPLLAWMLVPNTHFYSFGKYLFMGCDLITGYIILKLLQRNKQLSENKTIILASLWLLNPMVITISTRGSSESVLTVLIMLAVYFLDYSLPIAGFFLGLSIHFKIYPIIYLPSIMLYLSQRGKSYCNLPVIRWVNPSNIKLLVYTMTSVAVFNGIMYYVYGYEFLYHSYLYHLTRLDHRHNFSIYNVAMYFKSAATSNTSNLSLEKLAFIPQFLFAAFLIPLLFARENILSCFLLQTFAFVIFNKVMTSQYFIWFLIFLPHYLSESELLTTQMVKGIFVLILWVVSQGSWLFYAYKLEFLGESTFYYELFAASAFFFLTNCWILGIFMETTSRNS